MSTDKFIVSFEVEVSDEEFEAASLGHIRYADKIDYVMDTLTSQLHSADLATILIKEKEGE